MGVSLARQNACKTLVCAMLALLFTSRVSLASDPVPADVVAPPPGINILLYYNEFTDAGALPGVRGGAYAKNTHISVDIQALRYIRTFEINGMLSGLQIVQPYVSFLGTQSAGVQNIPAPAFAPPGAPGFGPGRARLGHGGGFAQPQLGAFIFPFARPDIGGYFVAGAWVDPPIGSYQKNASLNYAQNLWTGEIEAGARAVLVGDPSGQNLAIELWGEGYFYGDNSEASLVSPAVYANNIPALYQSFGATNPLRPASAMPARLSEQPSGTIYAYFPYQFFPLTRAAIIPGFFQSFGGKQVYTLDNGVRVDAGTRTEETQLRLVLSSYVSPRLQLMLNGEYDLAAHGGPLNRNIELRIATIF